MLKVTFTFLITRTKKIRNAEVQCFIYKTVVWKLYEYSFNFMKTALIYTRFNKFSEFLISV